MEQICTHPSPIKIDIGCGVKKQPNTIGFDRWEGSAADVICDLEHGIPIVSNAVDVAYASHFLEHAADLTKMMKELHRVCKRGAKICIRVPYCGSPASLENPDHKVLMGWTTMDFFTVETMGFPRLFKMVRKEWRLQGKNIASAVVCAMIKMTGGIRGPLRQFIEELYFELEVLK